MSNHTEDHAPGNDAKALLPVAIIGMLLLTAIMYYGGSSSGFF